MGELIMFILVLEDNAERIEAFKKKFFKDEIDFVDSSRAAIALLAHADYDLICLDHDLGGKEMEWKEEDCGMVVAKWLSKNPPVKAKIVIHSYNTPRALLMRSILPGASYIPGFWLE
jgi:CheY-like chemotaxis protein